MTADETPPEGRAEMKNSFTGNEKAILTTMVQGTSPSRIKELVAKGLTEGAEAFGMQFERLLPEYKSPDTYRELFGCTNGLPVYVTNYRYLTNEGKSDETLAKELLELADCGASLCDVMGDYFDKTEGEFTVNPNAVKKQEELIRALHEKGAQILMSSHTGKFTPAERVLEMALEYQRRGADIAKIVTNAESMAEQIENMRIITLLKEKLDIPFLFLCGGECSILRRIGGELGSCMYLCVCEYDEIATPVQPLLKHVKAIRDNMRG